MFTTKRMTTKRRFFNLYDAVSLIAAIYILSYMLCQHSVFPVCIDCAWDYFSHCTQHYHVLAVGLLPVYVALMVFGTAIIGVYLGSAIQRLASEWFHF